MIPLEELRERIDRVGLDATAANMDRILTILDALVQHVERIDRTAQHANNTASCLANGIQPD